MAKYRIKFSIGENNFEIESDDQKWLELKEKEYLERVLSSESQKRKLPEGTGITKKKEGAIPSNLTVQEFYHQYMKPNKITNRPNIAVFFVYYLIKIQKKSDGIKTADIAKLFGDISYPNYNKINKTDILSSAKRRALLNLVNKNWTLTLTGEDFVINLITGKGNE